MALILFCAFGGLLLIFLEFFFPGMVCALAGGVFLFTSLVFVFTEYSPLWGVLYFFFLICLVLAICKTALWWIKSKTADGEFYLNTSQEGFVASEYDRSALGKQGVAFTDLKPSGHVLIAGKQLQALCETGYVAKGAAIQVVGGRGAYLIVRCDQ
jgi:membrane-bound serine protease (ClpP class)